jgi:hypothetical protein
VLSQSSHGILEHGREPLGLHEAHGAGQHERHAEHEAGRQHHHERHQAMRQEVAVLLDAPGVIDGRAHGVEHAERRPHERDVRSDAERDGLILVGVDLAGDEVELAREVLEDEVSPPATRTSGFGRERPNRREEEQQEREERQQREVRDRGRVGEHGAVDQLQEAPPRRQPDDAQFSPDGARRHDPRHVRPTASATAVRPRRSTRQALAHLLHGVLQPADLAHEIVDDRLEFSAQPRPSRVKNR